MTQLGLTRTLWPEEVKDGETACLGSYNVAEERRHIKAKAHHRIVAMNLHHLLEIVVE